MPLVQNKLVEKNEGYGRTINQFFDLWIKPDFKKKKRKFEKEKFGAALIELFDNGRKPKIRLNQEVKIEIEFHSPKIKPEDVGKQIPIDLKEIKGLSWSQKGLDENSAKVLVARFNKDWWILNFDLRYNQGNVKKILGRAQEFLSGCKTVLRKKEYCPHVLIYLIWSVAELILDAKLLLHTQKTKKSHRKRKEKLKSPLGVSFFSPEFSSLLLTLYSIKNGARYADGDYSKKYDQKSLRKQVRILEKEIERI